MEKELFYVRNEFTSDKSNRWRLNFWDLVQQYLFKTSPKVFSRWRIFLLRLFGAEIGKGCYIASSVTITHPWELKIGNHCSLDANGLYIGPLSIGDYVSFGRCCHVISGTHDLYSRNFEIVIRPVSVGHGAFIGAGTYLGPGVRIGQMSVVAAHMVVLKSIPENTILIHNKLQQIKLPRLDPQEYAKYRYCDSETENL
jgi:putative colanic acid biosynthesis acetyltransferase WcaF